MPLGIREVLLIVRAQNLSSGVLRDVAGDFANLDAKERRAAQSTLAHGRALMAVGAGMGALGVAGLYFFGKATQSAIEYNRQVALTKTQMYGVKASFDQVAQAGLDVATKIAVPLDEIQAGLYDIFSSMDVNLSQAKFLLTNFSKEAVAGQVSLSVAERATIGIMNAYRLKVTDVTKVQDIMFNLVKYGVGTYENFATTIGRVTGPAVRANQTFEQTAALMAFTTRNGLSAANAASSVGRALDAIGKSRRKIQDIGKTVMDALGDETAKKLGFTAKTTIKVVDSAGKLLPVNVIMTNLGKALSGLNPTQLNDVLTAMFKGTGGTIQAMRFFDIAIHNFGQLNTLVKNMAQSKGALKAAYDTMANTPAMQIQLLKNNFHALMIEIGNILLPAVVKITRGLTTLFSWISKIPKPILTLIVVVGIITSVLLVLAGIVTVVAGAWLIFTTVLAASEIALGPILLIIGAVIAIVAALAFGAYELYKHWDTVSKWFHDMWFAMYRWIDHIWQLIWKAITDAWGKIEGVYNRIMHFITSSFDTWWKTHGEAIITIWNHVWGSVKDIFLTFWHWVEPFIKAQWHIIETIFKIAWAEISGIVKIAWAVIQGIFRIAWAAILGGWRAWWAVILAAAKIGWALIKTMLKIAWDILVAVFSVFLDILTGHWHQAWVDVLTVGKQIWNAIHDFLVTTWNAIKQAGGSIWHAMYSFFHDTWHAMYDTANGVWNAIWSTLKTIWGYIKGGAKTLVSDLSSIWGMIEGVFKVPVNFVIGTVYDSGIRRLWNLVMNSIGLKKFDLPFVKTLAGGGKLGGFGGGDRNLALLEDGEAVVDKNRTRRFAPILKAMGVPGFQGGGIMGTLGNLIGAGGDVGKMMLALVTGNQTAFANAFTSAMGGGSGGAGGNLAAMIAQLPIAMVKAAIAGFWPSAHHQAVKSNISGIGVIAQGAVGGNAYQNMAIARAMFPQWANGNQWLAWQALWTQESGWNQYAMNPSSGAYGIPQALPFTKMPRSAWPASAGGSSNVGAQVSWGGSYIGGRYGSPAAAWAHEVAFNWYGSGGSGVVTRPTLIGVGDGGPEHVEITPVGRGGRGPTQNFFITTQEINPRYHAAQLGWELARRSS